MKPTNKNLPILFLLGVFVIIYSLGYLYFIASMKSTATLMGIFGVFCLIICVRHLTVLHQWKKLGVVVPSAILAFVLLVGVNFLAYRFDFRFDVTKLKQHTLSLETEKQIKSLDRNIKLTAFYVGIPPKYLQDMFNEYVRVSEGMIEAEIIDPLVSLGYAAQFGTTINKKERKVFVQLMGSTIKREVGFTANPLSEEQLTNAIIRTVRKRSKVYFLTGHQENRTDNDENSGIKTFNDLLLENNIVSQQLVIGIAGTIPNDCDLLIISGPKDYLREEELSIIQEYLEKGGDALFLIEHVIVTTPDKPLPSDQLLKNPSLNEILVDWGVRIANDIVIDLESHASGDVGSPATRNYMSHRAIVGDLDYTFYVRPRSISMVKDRRATLRIAPLVLTASSEKSWGEVDRTLKVKFDKGVDRQGPVPIAFVMMERKAEEDSSDTRIAVFTDSDFITNAYIGHYSNAEMGLNIVNWLLESDYEVFIDSKQIKVERLDLTSGQKKKITLILFLIPVMILTWGIFVWIRQKVS